LGSGLSFGVCDAATGTAEREAAEIMLLAGRRPRTLATDDHYDEARCVATLRAARSRPRLAAPRAVRAIAAVSAPENSSSSPSA
jgi:hypothetical protein